MNKPTNSDRSLHMAPLAELSMMNGMPSVLSENVLSFLSGCRSLVNIEICMCGISDAGTLDFLRRARLRSFFLAFFKALFHLRFVQAFLVLTLSKWMTLLNALTLRICKLCCMRRASPLISRSEYILMIDKSDKLLSSRPSGGWPWVA